MIVEVNPIVNRVEVYEGAVYVPTQLPLSISASNVDAEPNQTYVLDSTAGALDITLPLLASIGDTVEVACFGDNGVSILNNGHKINGLDANFDLVALTSVRLRYVNDAIGWLSFSQGVTYA